MNMLFDYDKSVQRCYLVRIKKPVKGVFKGSNLSNNTKISKNDKLQQKFKLRKQQT